MMGTNSLSRGSAGSLAMRRASLLVALPLVLALALAALAATPAAAGHGGLHVTDLTDATLEADDLAESLVGAGVTVDSSSVALTGDDRAAGMFSGGTGIIGFEDGIIVSSGQAADVVGPNAAPITTSDFGTPGDADLTALAGVPTLDAAILEFDFEVGAGAEEVFFTYVFGSEEYNEYVGSDFNDVFAFWVNGENCAVVGDPAAPVSINTINNGQPGEAATNPHLYINNDPFSPDSTGGTVPPGDLLDTEMDGLTVPLTCQADVSEGTNTMRMGIADGSDPDLDSWVLIQAGSLTTTPPPPPPPDEVEAECVNLIAAQHTVAGEVCVANDGENLTVTYTTIDGWTLTETHLHLADDEAGLPQNRKGNPKVGHFEHSGSHNPAVSEFTYTISLAGLDAEAGDLLTIAAHAAVEREQGAAARVESAWGEGDRFVQRGNWAMWFTYEVQ